MPWLLIALAGLGLWYYESHKTAGATPTPGPAPTPGGGGNPAPSPGGGGVLVGPTVSAGGLTFLRADLQTAVMTMLNSVQLASTASYLDSGGSTYLALTGAISPTVTESVGDKITSLVYPPMLAGDNLAKRMQVAILGNDFVQWAESGGQAPPPSASPVVYVTQGTTEADAIKQAQAIQATKGGVVIAPDSGTLLNNIVQQAIFQASKK